MQATGVFLTRLHRGVAHLRVGSPVLGSGGPASGGKYGSSLRRRGKGGRMSGERNEDS
jgi:hypothetical protein